MDDNILFYDKERELSSDTDLFKDLNIDRIIAAVVNEKKQYDIKKFFLAPLNDIEFIKKRYEVFHDFEDPRLLKTIEAFCDKIYRVKKLQEESKSVNAHHIYKNFLFLESAQIYISSLEILQKSITGFTPNSPTINSFFYYISNYLESENFLNFKRGIEDLGTLFESLKFDILIDSLSIKVKKRGDEKEYKETLESLFKKFIDNNGRREVLKFNKVRGFNHINGKILEFLDKLYPKRFAKAGILFERYGDFLDENIDRFCYQIEFYLAYISYMDKIKKLGVSFCYPNFSQDSINVVDGYNLALVEKFANQSKSTVPNSFEMNEKERIVVVCGANQGGKSTFAKMIGQICYLFSLGLPIPSKSATLKIFDNIFTHFEKDESSISLRSKLEDDIKRVNKIIKNSNSKTLIILNEIFSSTSLDDAIYLSEEIAKRILSLNAYCVWVTFVDEVSNLNDKMVSYVAEVDLENSAKRRYEIVKKESNGLAYAQSIAKKYRLGYDDILKRIQ